VNSSNGTRRGSHPHRPRARSHLTDERAGAAIEWAAQHGVECLYFLADAADERTIQTAERHGFSLTDVRMELVAALDPALDGPRPASSGWRARAISPR